LILIKHTHLQLQDLDKFIIYKNEVVQSNKLEEKHLSKARKIISVLYFIEFDTKAIKVKSLEVMIC